MKNQNLPPVGTKVYHFQYGWGEVVSKETLINTYPIGAKFENLQQLFTAEGRNMKSDKHLTLSLTEYDLIKGGFTPISEWNKPKVGDIGYFWDEEDAYLNFGILTEISERFIGFEANNDIRWDNFSPTIPEWYTEKLKEIKANLASPCTQEQKEK